MSKRFALLAAILLVACGAPSTAPTPAISTRRTDPAPTVATPAREVLFPIVPTARPLVVAHRGGAGLAPEKP